MAGPYPKSVTQPAFLVGAERSGTTLLRLMLVAHPRLAVVSEFEYAVDPLVSRPNGVPPGDVLRDHVAQNHIFRAHGFAPDKTLNYRDQIHDFLRQGLAEKEGADMVLAVVHREIDQIPRLFDGGKYIHIVRDPRDVARSNIGMGWAGNVYFGVDRWIEVERQWARLKTELPVEDVYELRQERLIHEPEKVIGELCDFLGLDYLPAMMEFDEGTTYEKPDPSLTEQWRRKLTEHEVGLIEARVGDLLEARGYQPSGFAPVTPTGTEVAKLQWTNKTGILRHRIGVNGLSLLLQDTISRKLGMKGWQQRLKPRLLEARERALR